MKIFANKLASTQTAIFVSDMMSKSRQSVAMNGQRLFLKDGKYGENY